MIKVDELRDTAQELEDQANRLLDVSDTIMERHDEKVEDAIYNLSNEDEIGTHEIALVLRFFADIIEQQL